ncbi:MAG: PIG-L family deacetylase [Bdellovibrionales bacterium]|jgi:LmbE family N-acetylglucosaminyl deacetylase
MPDFGHHILILVPHPDDEVVACAATIGRAQALGARIYSLYLTNGCIARNALWPWQREHYRTMVARRHKEAELAAKRLKVKPLAFADRPSRYAINELPTVLEEIRYAIASHDIDQLWVPAYEGGHTDHDAINGVCSLLKQDISILEFSEYNYAGGKAHSNHFSSPNGTERLVRLTDEEKGNKQTLLNLYASERSNLGTIKTDHEVFRPLASYDYAQPPHEGKLWYARFQWVPFRHPRIDFTKPAQVSEAITALKG